MNELSPIKYFKYLWRLLWSIFFKDFTFLMWTIFKGFTTLLLFYVLFCFVWPHSMWDLSYPTRDWTHSPCTGKVTSKPPDHQGSLLEYFMYTRYTLWIWWGKEHDKYWDSLEEHVFNNIIPSSLPSFPSLLFKITYNWENIAPHYLCPPCPYVWKYMYVCMFIK